MSNASAEFLAELEFTSFCAPSLMNSVITRDGGVVLLNKELWDASPVLRRHSIKDVSCFELNASRSTVESVLEVHRNGSFPHSGTSEDFENLLNILDAACELELQDLTSKVAAMLLETKEFSECDYPVQCSTRTVMHCFKKFLGGPFRSADIYKRQLRRVAKHCDNSEDVMYNAINLVKQHAARFLEMNLEGIPVDFGERTIPIAIYNRSGLPQTVVYDGSHFIPVDLLGKNFSPALFRTGDSFYIKYGSYMLYKSESRIHRKDLCTGEAPTGIMKDCTHLLTRGNFVLAVQHKGNFHTVWLWSHDHTFIRILMTPRKIEFIDFDYDTRLLAMKLAPNLIRVYSLTGGRDLILLTTREFAQVSGLLLLRQHMYLTVQRPQATTSKNICILKTYSIPSLDESDLEVTLSEDHATLKRAGNVLFLENAGNLQVVDEVVPRFRARTLSTSEESPVLSELWMSP